MKKEAEKTVIIVVGFNIKNPKNIKKFAVAHCHGKDHEKIIERLKECIRKKSDNKFPITLRVIKRSSSKNNYSVIEYTDGKDYDFAMAWGDNLEESLIEAEEELIENLKLEEMPLYTIVESLK